MLQSLSLPSHNETGEVVLDIFFFCRLSFLLRVMLLFLLESHLLYQGWFRCSWRKSKQTSRRSSRKADASDDDRVDDMVVRVHDQERLQTHGRHLVR